MQKKLIALAVAGLVSGAAFAQSNVTIYGVADIGYAYADGKDQRFSGLVDGNKNGTRIGFKGEEALGNGLKAKFVIETGYLLGGGAQTVDAATGAFQSTNAPFHNMRQAYLGLSGNWGDVMFGRQYSPKELGGAQANDYGFYASNILWGAYDQSFGTGGALYNDRWNNAIVYQSPVWSGFSLRTQYAFGQQSINRSAEDESRFGLGLKYAAGPLEVAGFYAATMNINENPAKTYSLDLNKTPSIIVNGGPTRANVNSDDTGNIHDYMLAVAYDFKVVRPYINYRYSKNTATDVKVDNWLVGATIPVSANGTVIAEVGQVKLRGGENDTFTGLDSGERAKTIAYSVGYEHNLSKRTMFYTNVGVWDNNDHSNFAWKGVGSNETDHTSWGVVTGLRHNF